MKKIVSERVIIPMIVATLVVVFLIWVQLLLYTQQTRKEAVTLAGRSVVRLLSNLSIEQLVPAQGRNAILESLNQSQATHHFAYAAIVNLQNQPFAVTSSGKQAIPKVALENEKTLWTPEQILDTELGKLLEFRAPFNSNGEMVGYIRLGYFLPGYIFELRNLPFFTKIALPIFLLAPLTYYLIRRELKPLSQASAEIREALKKQHINAMKDSPDDFQDFMQGFKLFMSMNDRRFEQLSNENIKAQSATLALSYQRRRIESALQSLPDALLVIDEAGMATFANSKLAPVIGCSLDLVLGSKPNNWCDDDNVIDLLRKYHSNNSPLQRPESVEFKPKHDPEKTIEVSAYPLFAPKDPETICGTLVVFHDKTREVLANLARDEFISHVAHELKSPLNVIRLYAESLLNLQGVSDENRINAINTINDEVDRLSLLISNLLNITKIEAGNIALNLQRIKFIEFLEDTFNSIARSGGENKIRFDLQLHRALPNIQADKDLLRIALNNLLTNAVKYNNPGGSVSLSAEEVGDKIVVRVSDNGIGVAEKDQDRIFDKFYRSSDQNVREKSGHGLGLSLAKEIIELHHGKIKLESSPGNGSIFTIELIKPESTF